MNQNYQTLAAAGHSGNRVPEEGAEFITKRDGNGGEVKVINLNWDGWCPRSGMVELVPLKYGKGFGNALRHHNEASFKTTPDKRHGYIIGILMPGYDKNKNLQFERITVRGAEFLDLSNKKDREKWICLKNGPFVEGSPNFHTQTKTIYRAVDKEKEVNNFKLNLRKRDEAYSIAKGLVGEELIEMGVALGEDPKVMSEETLWMKIVQMVQNETKDPITKKTGAEVFLEIYNSDTRIELTILKRALNTGIVSHSLTDNVIQYNGMPLGHTEQEAVHFLKNNPTTRTSIDMLSRKTNEGSTQLHTVKPVETEESLIIKRQAAELAELKARLANTNKPVETVADELNLNNENSEGFVLVDGKKVYLDSEYQKLIEEADRLLIKGCRKLGENKPMQERKRLLSEKIRSVKEKVTN